MKTSNLASIVNPEPFGKKALRFSIILVLLLTGGFKTETMKNAGVTTRASVYSVKETIDKIRALVEKNGGTIYARIDQQADVKKAGLTILPLEFLLFGNPAVGGKLMLENPVMALDLPLKIIAWEDEQHKVWIAYNEAAWLQERYGLKPDSNSPLSLDKLITLVLTH